MEIDREPFGQSVADAGPGDTKKNLPVALVGDRSKPGERPR
jgi:hypothetical protein